MGKVINITDKLNNKQPAVVIGEKTYPVDNGVLTVMKFEELAQESSGSRMMEAVKLALGEDAVKELDIDHMSLDNFKVLITAVLAAMQDMDYDEAVSRFRSL